jgi:hypothetical protein
LDNGGPNDSSGLGDVSDMTSNHRWIRLLNRFIAMVIVQAVAVLTNIGQ